jgi:hypothetical protein
MHTRGTESELESTFGELFMEAQSSRIEWKGLDVHSMYEFAEAPETLTVKIKQRKAVPIEGLRVSVRDGIFRIEDTELGREFDLWADMVPESGVATLEIQRTHLARRPSLAVWNVWQVRHQVVHAWIGNAGMLLETTDGGLTLRCSDGTGEPTFDDLVVEIT